MTAMAKITINIAVIVDTVAEHTVVRGGCRSTATSDAMRSHINANTTAAGTSSSAIS